MLFVGLLNFGLFAGQKWPWYQRHSHLRRTWENPIFFLRGANCKVSNKNATVNTCLSFHFSRRGKRLRNDTLTWSGASFVDTWWLSRKSRRTLASQKTTSTKSGRTSTNSGKPSYYYASQTQWFSHSIRQPPERGLKLTFERAIISSSVTQSYLIFVTFLALH